MYTYPPPKRRRSWLLWLFPLMLVCGVIVLILLPALPDLALRIAGFEPQGSIEDFFEQQAQVITPLPLIGITPVQMPGVTPQAQPQVGAGLDFTVPGGPNPNPTAAASNSVAAGSGGGTSLDAQYFRWAETPQSFTLTSSSGSRTVNSGETFAEILWVGEGIDGQPLGMAQYSEHSLRSLCDYWLNGCGSDQFRGQSIDLRPGGAIIYGSVNVGGLWQDLGLVITVAPDGQGIVAQGVVNNGQLYAVPTQGEIAEAISRVVGTANDTLGQVRVQASGFTMGVAGIEVTENRLVLVLR